MCPPEKRRDGDPLRRRAVRSLKSGLPVSNRKIRALFAYFVADRAEILCSSDCMAERMGFEPSVPFCHAKPRLIRKLQIVKPYQRISRQIRRQRSGNQSSFDSPSIRETEANTLRFCGRKKWFTSPGPWLIGFAGDCVPSGQSENRNLYFGEKKFSRDSDFSRSWKFVLALF